MKTEMLTVEDVEIFNTRVVLSNRMSMYIKADWADSAVMLAARLYPQQAVVFVGGQAVRVR